MDWLRSCYRSNWKLFRGADTLTPGRYYFSPPGTPFYPAPHNLGSINWVNDERVGQTLGEFPQGRRPYTKGTLPIKPPPASLIGSADCIELGEAQTPPLPIQRSLVSGFDSRCWTAQGLPVPPSPVWAPLVWLTPASLPAAPDGTPVANWSDTSGARLDLTRSSATGVPALHLAGLGGLPELATDDITVLLWNVPLALGQAHTIYIVGTLGPDVGFGSNGPSLIGAAPTDVISLDTSSTGMDYAFAGGAASLLYNSPPSTPLLWWWRRSPARVELGARTLGVANVNIQSALGLNAGYLRTTFAIPAVGRTSQVSEILIWACTLDDAAHAGVLAYLTSKYPV